MTLKLLLGKSEEEDPSRLVWAASDRNRLIVVLGGRGERGRGGEPVGDATNASFLLQMIGGSQ